MKDDLQHYLDFAKELANEAGAIMMNYYRLNHEVTLKSDNSPVTLADKAVNSLVIEKVKAHFPTHGVLGEEESFAIDSEYLWVCDPIDGTVAYIYHMPVAMFSLALVRNGEPIVAVAHNPCTDDLYSATKGGGAYRNNARISVSKRKWGSAVIVRTVSNQPGDSLDSPHLIESFQRAGNKLPQTYGGVFKGCLVAEGSVDAQIFPGSGAHDVAAIKLIVEEAGGKVTDLLGENQPYNQPINGAILTNSKIHEDVVKTVRSYANNRD